MKRNFIDLQQNTEQWFTEKLGRISASYAKNLFMGKNTVGYKIDLIDRIAFERVFGEMVEGGFQGNRSTERGHDLEPIAAKKYSNITMTKCTNGGFHTYGDYLGASLDRNLEDLNGKKINGCVEIKCFEHKHHEEIALNEAQFIKELHHQVQFQLYVSGYEFNDQFGYHPLYKDIKVRIYPDLEYFEKLEVEIKLAVTEIEKQIKIKQILKR